MSKPSNFLEIYTLIKSASNNLAIRNNTKLLREEFFQEFKPLKKMAFDTRRIDQDKDYNPRRGLQHYSRSDDFVSEEDIVKINNIKKLKNITALLHEIFNKDDAWHDSFSKTLYTGLENAVNDFNKLGNFSTDQKSLTGLHYIEQLLNIRYGINLTNMNINDNEILNIILKKDEELLNKFNKLNLSNVKLGVEPPSNLETISTALPTRKEVAEVPYHTLIEKLFGEVKATVDNPNVERSITITIKDKLNKE